MSQAKLYEKEYGFIPADLANRSVSIALEYAYNYWTVATMAEDMGRQDLAEVYYEKAKRYKTYFNKETGFMRGKNLDGSWLEPFHPRYANHTGFDPYTEGNAWQWTWFVPHDVEGLSELMGGREAFSEKLDSLFSVSSEVLGEHAGGDITGLIGQYAHGNEPSHHIAYMFNEVDKPWRTQEIVTQILDEFYTDQPDGLCGNEDCGAMSAWYILSSMGFYPMCPGDVRYSIGRPSFDEVEIQLENGKVFIVRTENRSEQNPYVQEVRLNGKKLTEPYITHGDIESGASLEFVMGPEKTVFFH
jgi:predicted alpha-1,2-mannosidase